MDKHEISYIRKIIGGEISRHTLLGEINKNVGDLYSISSQLRGDHFYGDCVRARDVRVEELREKALGTLNDIKNIINDLERYNFYYDNSGISLVLNRLHVYNVINQQLIMLHI